MKNAVNSSMTRGVVVSSNRYCMIYEGQVSMEPRWSLTACSRDMASLSGWWLCLYMCEFSVYICGRRVWRGSWTTPTRARGEGDIICWLVHSHSCVALRQHANQQIFEWRRWRPASRFLADKACCKIKIVLAGKTFCISTVLMQDLKL